ncbi:M4 family metallopeptidase [Dyadobacter arcticus]|uniref:Peptidase M4 C-terminal domain-containing protein n=1 Tax=Dyadobacter arcticus TaxID=1078754 RepID=A0ABX0UNN5_9BACT|nr:M4 family metallopeptidase [Dyadobacter arcticus]NIJ53589.1 hypothetical protein [Dyadobacter arcticus]
MKVWYTRFTKRILLLIFFWIGNWIHYSAFGQSFYPQQQYQPGQPASVTTFGTLYNPVPILIHSAATYYHGPQDVWATAYLPFESEYDASKTAIPFSQDYTTAIALTSAKNDALGLYAPIEVIALAKSPNTNLMNRYPFASVVPNNVNQATYTGPFNTLKDLNQNDPSFNNPLASEYAISVLEAAQKYTKFTHDFFGHNGIDKQGDIVILANVNNSPDALTGFDTEEKAFYFSVSALPGYPHVERSTIGHELTHALLNFGNLGNLDYLEGTEIASLNESFADIIGLSFENWVDPNKKFVNPNWIIANLSGPFPVNKAYRPFDNPKFRNSPNTYKGTYWKLSSEPGYRPHNNGMVMSHWFYLLNVAKSGYIDDDPARGSYITAPLIPGDKTATYTLALKIIFKAMTEKLAYLDGFPEMRIKTLEAAVELGNPVG